MEKLPELLANTIEFNRFSILLTNKDFENLLNLSDSNTSKKTNLIVSRIFFNGSWFKILSVGNYPCSKPQFTTLRQLTIGHKK